MKRFILIGTFIFLCGQSVYAKSSYRLPHYLINQCHDKGGRVVYINRIRRDCVGVYGRVFESYYYTGQGWRVFR